MSIENERLARRFFEELCNGRRLDVGIPATGKEIAVDAISIMRIENGRIAEHWCTWDTLGLLQQIGAVPAPATA